MNRAIIEADSKQMFVGPCIPLWVPMRLEEILFFQTDMNKSTLFKSYAEANGSIILL